MMPVQSRPAIMVDNRQLGMLLFIAAEVMFFVGLIGAYLVFRMGGATWPPPDQPHLPVLISGLNTLFLLGSGWTIRMASRKIQHQSVMLWEGLTLGLGLMYLIGQGLEWQSVHQFGLTVETGPYGFTLYILVGLHALHMVGALIWRAVDIWPLFYSGQVDRDTTSSRMYWYFVVGLWPVLFALVYLF